MKELEIKPSTQIEVSVKKKQQIEHQFLESLIPYSGHSIWEIDTETMEVKKASYTNVTYHFGGEFKKEVIVKKGCYYVSALNQRTALNKYKNGLKGGVKTLSNPLSL